MTFDQYDLYRHVADFPEFSIFRVDFEDPSGARAAYDEEMARISETSAAELVRTTPALLAKATEHPDLAHPEYDIPRYVEAQTWLRVSKYIHHFGQYGPYDHDYAKSDLSDDDLMYVIDSYDLLGGDWELIHAAYLARDRYIYLLGLAMEPDRDLLSAFQDRVAELDELIAGEPLAETRERMTYERAYLLDYLADVNP